jgi:hypothetical protein
VRTQITLLAVLICGIGCAQDNGIGVGRPKVFDVRSLTIMLQQLNDQLRAIQVVDPKKLAASFGLLQGYQAQDTAQSLSVATPFATTKQTFDKSGNPTGTEKDTTPGGSGSAPALPDLMPDPSGFSPQFGASPEDLLTDQVDLSYRIFNLRMLLEQSLSDRLWSTRESDSTTAPQDCPGENEQNPSRRSPEACEGPRLQAVIGFNVSVTPPEFAKGKAAVVEVTIRVDDRQYPSQKYPVSLVSLMPQEKTYNSAALAKSSKAFGGSAVAKVVTVGYSFRHRTEKLYLYRDADTISFENMDSAGSDSSGGHVTFGWEFRPVLGRAAVSPGIRQMFAVIALPEPDLPYTNSKPGLPFTVHIRTYWKKYSGSTLTTKVEHKAEREADFTDGTIPFTADSQRDLAPRIKHVSWVATGPATAVATIDGANFFAGTSVVLGTQTYSAPIDGLIQKSDQSLQLNTTIAALANGDAVLNGRYGPSRMIKPDIPPDTPTTPYARGIVINSMEIDPNPARQLWRLKLTIQSRDNERLTPDDVRSPGITQPILSVAGAPIPGPYQYQGTRCQLPGKDGTLVTSDCVLIQALLPAASVNNEAMIAIRFPLLGPDWFDSQIYYNFAQVSRITRIGGGSRTTLAITGEGFSDDSRVQLDRVYTVRPGELTREGGYLLLLDIDTAVLGQYKSIVLIPAAKALPAVLDIPAAKADTAPAKPIIDSGQVATATVGSAPAVTFTGSGLSGFTGAKFGRETLPTKVSDDGKSIQIFLSRQVTSTDGTVLVLLTSADGSVTPVSVRVTPKTGATAK